MGAALFLAALFVLLIISPENIDPLNVRWCVNGGGDNLQHYLGWRFFRNSRWTRYFLFMKDLNYPAGTSVIVTDSNPLLCLLFKLFGKILPETFQFNGIWILFCYLMQAFFAVLIGRRLTDNFWLTSAGAVMAVLNPVVLQRTLIHENLAAHWLILAAVWLFLHDEQKWNPVGWFILSGLTLLIHIYFIPMIGFILLLQLIRMALKKASFLKIMLPLLVFAGTLAAGYFGLGYSYILPQSGSFGELSMNLNAFINPDGVSSVLRDRPALPLQYEGFNYLGAGLLLLAAAGIICAGRNGIVKILPFFLPAIILVLVAASQNAYFDLYPVYHISLPEKVYELLSAFRSSGRLAWPVYYLILFSSLYFLGKRSEKYPFLVMTAVLCVLLQIFDLKEFCLHTAERFRDPSNPIAEITQDVSDALSGNVRHLYSDSGDSKTVDALALFAANHHMTFNRIANARGIKPVFGDEILDMRSLDCSQIRPESVYIYFSADDLPENLDSCGSVKISDINGWILVRSLQ